MGKAKQNAKEPNCGVTQTFLSLWDLTCNYNWDWMFLPKITYCSFWCEQINKSNIALSQNWYTFGSPTRNKKVVGPLVYLRACISVILHSFPFLYSACACVLVCRWSCMNPIWSIPLHSAMLTSTPTKRLQYR